MRNINGYTLIEIMVAVSIFFIVIAGPTSFLIYSLKSQQRVLAYQTILDNVSYALEYMSRAVRMAEKDDREIGGDSVSCLAGYMVNFEVNGDKNEIKFRNYNNKCQRFYFEDGKLMMEDEQGSVPLTSDDLEITSLKFEVSGEEQEDDNFQPKVTILMNIRKNIGAGSQPEIRIQTTISQRNFDVLYSN